MKLLKILSVRANHKPYLTTTIKKVNMIISSLEGNYYRHSTPENSKAYIKQKLYKKGRRKYYSSLYIKTIKDNKKFMETIKPFL